MIMNAVIGAWVAAATKAPIPTAAYAPGVAVTVGNRLCTRVARSQRECGGEYLGKDQDYQQPVDTVAVQNARDCLVTVGKDLWKGEPEKAKEQTTNCRFRPARYLEFLKEILTLVE